MQTIPRVGHTLEGRAYLTPKGLVTIMAITQQKSHLEFTFFFFLFTAKKLASLLKKLDHN
jgi:hypothetical protein